MQRPIFVRQLLAQSLALHFCAPRARLYLDASRSARSARLRVAPSMAFRASAPGTYLATDQTQNKVTAHCECLVLPEKMTMGKADNTFLESSKIFDVTHVTAVVTGGGSGIGLMMTQALVANGAKVYIVDRRESALKTVVDLYNTGPGRIIAQVILTADISQKDSVQQLAATIANSEPTGIQLLVNNAGITRDDATRFDRAGEPDLGDPQSISTHFMKSEPEHWAEAFQTNCTGGFYMSMAFLPLLAKGHAVIPGYTSSIINTCSNSALLKHTTHGHISYAASKAAFLHLSRMLSTTFAQTGVRVNMLAPGIFPTEMTAGASGADQKSKLEQMAMPNVAGRPGHETDMAATILLLAGRGGSFYYNQILHPDGGEMLSQPTTM